MRITRIELENVKSYDRAVVEFTSGTNAICGRNGAGKSTLLEAIGFTLFDHLAVTQADFVRRGEKRATARVAFEADDGRVYEVVRSCGSSSQYYAFDPELDQRLTEGATETVIWLHDILGIEPTTDLEALFRDAVGVPQGLLTAAFLDTPSRRKDVFNPLLRVDEYEQVWSGLREPGSWLDRRVTTQEGRIAGLEARVSELPGAERRAEALAAELAEAEAGQSRRREALDAVEARLEALDAAEAELDSLSRVLEQVEMEVKALRDRKADAAASLDQAEAAKAVVEETRDDFEAYESAQQVLADLESERSERDRLREEAQALERDLALVVQRLESLEAQRTAVEEAAAMMADLAPRVEEQDRLASKLEAARRRADRLESAVQTLETERQSLRELEAAQASMEEELEVRGRVERKLAGLRETLAETEAARESRAAEVAAQEIERARLESESEAAEARCREAETALSHAEETLASLRARLDEVREALQTRSACEEALASERASLGELGDRVEALAAERAQHRTTLEQARTRVAALEAGEPEEAECPVCGQPLTAEHRTDLLSRYRQEVASGEGALEELADQREALEEERREREAAVASLESRLKTLPRPEEAEEIEARVEVQTEEAASAQAALAAARARASEVSAALSEVKAALDGSREALDAVSRRRQALRDDVRAKDARLDGLPRQEELERLRAQIDDRRDAVEKQQGLVSELSDAPEAEAQAEGALKALGDPRREYRRAKDVVDRRDEVSEALDTARTRKEELEARRAALDEKLERYADLDDRIEAERAALREHEAAYRRYVSHLREAEALDDHRRAYERLDVELSEAARALEAKRKARAEARAEYDAEAHAAVKAERGDLREALAALNERIHQQRARLEETEAEVERLQAVASELREAEAERDELQALRDLLEYLRGVLREAGPAVTRRLVEVISLRADRLYREIMQDYTARLRWSEEYEIILRANGRERTFQQLSGGEQMAAALAVRLALLQEISTINVAFFDEPTANLDDQRRESLAEQILSIQGFSQLFVISHDDTFEQDTDHVVRVNKVEGVSQVEE